MKKIYIDLDQYNALEVKGSTIKSELIDEGVDVRQSHLDNGLYTPSEVKVEIYSEQIEILKENGETETIICETLYENGMLSSRISEKIYNLMMSCKDISEYGKEVSKDFIGLLSTQEISEMYGINESTVRKAIMEKRIIEGKDCKKFGKSWIVREEVAEKMWGENK